MKKYIIIPMFLFAGCCETQYVYVPQKCIVPTVVQPTYSNDDKSLSYEDRAKIKKTNDTLKNKYIEKLKQSISVCQ